MENSLLSLKMRCGMRNELMNEDMFYSYVILLLSTYLGRTVNL